MKEEEKMTNGTYTLAELRQSRGLSQSQVARRMGIGQAQVSRIEGAYPKVMFTSLTAYFEALGLDIRFSGDGTLNVVSSQVVPDPEREKAATKRRQDPTRSFPNRSREVQVDM